MEEENGYFCAKMDDLGKVLKECRGERDYLNNKLEESKKRNLLIQSEATANTNNGFSIPPVNPYPPQTSVLEGGFPGASPSIVGGGALQIIFMTTFTT